MTLLKKVQFSNDDTIVYTHSAIDYDRSPFAGASAQLHAFRAQCLSQAPVHNIPTNDLKVTVGKKLKTQLKINTSTLCGPLFFTALSTNYSRFE